MDKKTQIAFLEEQLDNLIKMYLQNEYQYRSVVGLDLSASSGNASKQANENKEKAKGAKQMIEAQIRNLRNLVKEIKADEFVV